MPPVNEAGCNHSFSQMLIFHVLVCFGYVGALLGVWGISVVLVLTHD